MSLSGKKILLGVTGSIAAYKAAMLTRLLVKENAEVQVIMTPDTQAFITPLTLSTLSKNPVHSLYYDEKSGEWTNHIRLAEWADLMLIAPATANTLAKMNTGICDNLLLAVYLSMRTPVMAAPAMDLEMWQHIATRRNIASLKSDGLQIIEPEEGELASGLEGKGRMAEPENIVQTVRTFFESEHAKDFLGIKAIVTAGPTYEAIDPVRFIGNHSSGKMGIAIANELCNRGAEVTLIAGPVEEALLKTIYKNIRIKKVTSALEMKEACEQNFHETRLTIMAAAVADYAPIESASFKIKKSEDSLSIQLKKTDDVLAGLGKAKKSGQILVGFALETDNELTNAHDKLIRKNLDLIVLNSLNDVGAGFGTDTNRVSLISKNMMIELPLLHKQAVAHEICNHLKPLLKS